MSGPRKPDPQDAEVWDKVARTVRRMHPARPVVAQMPEKPLNAAPPLRVPQAALTKPVHKPAAGPRISVQRAPDIDEALRAAPLRMDARVFDRMTRGKLTPEARIDLHGMTLAEAHQALLRFVLRCHAERRRLVLVITGKGGRTTDGSETGLLKRQVPMWLQLPPLSSHVLQISTASARHGGSGAYYLYLRRG